MSSKVERTIWARTKAIRWGLWTAMAIVIGCGTPSSNPPSGTAGSGGSAGTGGSGGAGGEGGIAPTVDWTEFTESADTQKIYVSFQQGDDANDGMSPEKPVKTIAKGKSLLRDGKPDWLLLRRGEIWLEGLGEWTLSGRSAKERMVVSSYGDEIMRPTLMTGSASALTAFTGPVTHVAFVGMHFYSHTRDPFGMTFISVVGNPGIQWFVPTDDLLIEDVVVQSYAASNITIQGKIANFALRRSIIIDAYNTSGTSQGLYLEGVENALIEENLFDHNGWNEHPVLIGLGTEATAFNHNVYIQPSCNKVTFQRNITARASNQGLQARAGGIVRDNVVVDNPIAISYGLALAEWDPKAGGVTGEVSGNFISDSGDVSPTIAGGVGIQLANINSAKVDGNIIVYDDSALTSSVAIEVTRKPNSMVAEQVANLTIQNNVVYDWRGGLRYSTNALSAVVVSNNDVQAPVRESELVRYAGQAFSSATSYNGNHWFSIAAPGTWFAVDAMSQTFDQWQMTSGETGATSTQVSYVDPTRNLGTYHGTLGKDATIAAYLTEARMQSIKNWRVEYMAMPVLQYVRQGFAKP